MKKIKKPTLSAGTRSGGHMKDLGDILIFMYPGQGKRKIDCTVSTYAGVCPGAVHFFAHVEEAPNYAWDSKEGCWCRPWDADVRFQGFREEAKFDTWEDAFKWIRCILREKADPKLHCVTFDDHTDYGPIPPFFWEEREKKPAEAKDVQVSEAAYYKKYKK